MRKPFRLIPGSKDYLWGGNRLNEEFNKNIDKSPLAETWECSTHKDGPSYVATGEFTGQSLIDVLYNNPEFLGKNNESIKELPILIKLIDAKQNLSIQVHPDDDYAREVENQLYGKNELWYVLSSEEGAELIYGMKESVDKETVIKAIEDGTLEDYLLKVPVKENDIFFIKAGTIHAICAGVVLLEVQQSSNLTYRLYDYNRIDKDGNKRELHIKKSLDVSSLSETKIPDQKKNKPSIIDGAALELLQQTPYFKIERLTVNTENTRVMPSVQTDELSFQSLVCISGTGTLIFEGGNIPFIKGDCMFIPANSEKISIQGMAQLVKVTC